MKKHIYKVVKINAVDREWLANEVRGKAVVVGNDVAKENHRAAVVLAETGRTVVTLAWQAPGEQRDFVALLRSLPASSLAVVVEPTGSYGDPLRWQLGEAGIAVYRVSPKRAHDASEVYDGVPSSHDPKMAAVLARMHRDGLSQPWPADEPVQRDLKAAIETLARYTGAAQQLQNQLEARLARHWPEVEALLALDSVSLLALLARFGGPETVAAQAGPARQLLHAKGGRLLSSAKVEAVLASAAQTVGCPPTAGERRALQDLATELLRQLAHEREAKRAVEKLAQAHAGIAAMAAVVGMTTAAVVFAKVGDPGRFPSAAAYEKAAGLNVKERSSGKYQGQRKITKRGPGSARKVLYLAVLRWIQKPGAFATWYERKVARDGGKTKLKAIVALMRKLIRALWHVGQGEAFDEAKLFDLRRLGLAA
jgi:transposase